MINRIINKVTGIVGIIVLLLVCGVGFLYYSSEERRLYNYLDKSFSCNTDKNSLIIDMKEAFRVDYDHFYYFQKATATEISDTIGIKCSSLRYYLIHFQSFISRVFLSSKYFDISDKSIAVLVRGDRIVKMFVVDIVFTDSRLLNKQSICFNSSLFWVTQGVHIPYGSLFFPRLCCYYYFEQTDATNVTTDSSPYLFTRSVTYAETINRVNYSSGSELFYSGDNGDVALMLNYDHQLFTLHHHLAREVRYEFGQFSLVSDTLHFSFDFGYGEVTGKTLSMDECESLSDLYLITSEGVKNPYTGFTLYKKYDRDTRDRLSISTNPLSINKNRKGDYLLLSRCIFELIPKEGHHFILGNYTIRRRSGRWYLTLVPRYEYRFGEVVQLCETDLPEQVFRISKTYKQLTNTDSDLFDYEEKVFHCLPQGRSSLEMMRMYSLPALRAIIDYFFNTPDDSTQQ